MQDDALQRAQRPLEMFFPFDPYLLKRSSAALSLGSSYIRCVHACACVHVRACMLVCMYVHAL